LGAGARRLDADQPRAGIARFRATRIRMAAFFEDRVGEECLKNLYAGIGRRNDDR